MTYKELIDKVSTIIQDPSFTDEVIGDYLNQAQVEIAGGMMSTLGSWITPPLPNLLTVDTVTTAIDAAYVSMPSNFQRTLQFAASSNGYELDIAESFISFSTAHPLLNQVGPIHEVIEAGGSLYYQGIPAAAEDITLHFYRAPTAMEDEEDEPDGIPVHLQLSLLVNHAAWKLFELIEDDFTSAGANTQRYQTLFMHASRVLELSIPNDARGMSLS